ncbi:O-antigen ligase [Blastococcus sp. KM273128]|uniref:O-antigen ligase family protein n=1 Tax=Blastococcus sp. KM273128 TaxID=2570314 RepID=UPI001F2120FB|nr:O-antigen ligase family protein [Blastococcus sp. KM273128]
MGRAAGGAWRPGWPLTALFAFYPVWWALGMGTLIVFVLAVPMALELLRRRPVRVPPGFGLWLVFLLWVVASTVMLGVDPAGTLPGEAADRVVSVGFNLAGYVAVAVAMLYLGNLTEEEYPRSRAVRHLGGLFVVVVAGGLLGTFADQFSFTSPVEMLLPDSVARNAFVQNLVHPTAAQLQEVLGYTAGRPAAPFGYTNTWGYALSLLLGWFAIGWLRRPGARRLAGVLVLALAAIPVVHSLNRGVWIGLGLTVLFAALWLARNGNLGALLGLAVSVVLVVVLVLTTPLTSTIQQRLDNPKSDGIRGFTVSRTLEVVQESPVLGFGSTRRALGSSNSIAVGRDEDCSNCGNPLLGSNGQLWLLLIAQGVVGAALYLGFFTRVLWAYRRDRSALAAAAFLSIGLPFVYMFLYNALVVPLLISFLSVALLWRNDQARRAEAGSTAGPGSRAPGLVAGSAR